MTWKRGFRRLKLASFRRLAPELMLSAKTQRWAPRSSCRLGRSRGRRPGRLHGRGQAEGGQFPGRKSFDEFDFSVSSVPRATLDYLASLEWVRAKENPCFVGPPGTGKSHCLVALGHAAVEAGYKVRYFVATELVDTLYRGLADNSVGKVIESVLRADVVICDEVGFAPLDDNGAQLLFRFVAAAYERRSLAIASHWPFEQWGHFLPNQDNRGLTARPPHPPQHPRGHRRNAKLVLSVTLSPTDPVPGLHLHPEHRRRLRQPPVSGDESV